ncbi:MAG: LysR family transcriptional regulator [Mesorhizobium sp.]
MVTFKQLEALYWIGTLGSFEAAAQHLDTTQSAISKRIQELEASFGVAVFDRSRRVAHLTPKGVEMLELAAGLLEQRTRFAERFSAPDLIERRLRIGATEASAMTWLGRFVGRLRQSFPKVVIEIVVDSANVLAQKLTDSQLDLAVVPDGLTDPRFQAIPVASSQWSWACAPSLISGNKKIALKELAEHTILLRTDPASEMLVGTTLRGAGVTTSNIVGVGNFLALLSMTVGGVGVSALPTFIFDAGFAGEAIRRIDVVEQVPDLKYLAVFPAVNASPIMTSVVKLVQETCDFSKAYMAASPEGSGVADLMRIATT